MFDSTEILIVTSSVIAGLFGFFWAWRDFPPIIARWVYDKNGDALDAYTWGDASRGILPALTACVCALGLMLLNCLVLSNLDNIAIVITDILCILVVAGLVRLRGVRLAAGEIANYERAAQAARLLSAPERRQALGNRPMGLLPAQQRRLPPSPRKLLPPPRH
jgi:hypothetical protein